MQVNHPRIALGLAAAALLAGAIVEAAECRATDKVIASGATIKANGEHGGHVSIHIKGQKTEATKSQFNSEADFKKAWEAWKAHAGAKGPKPKVCGGAGGGSMDCVPVALAGNVKGYVCDTIDGEGKCTAGHNIDPVSVAFRYAKNDKGVWILNTAYPSVNDDCQ